MELVWVPGMRRQSWEFVEVKVQGIIKQSTGNERAEQRENSRDMKRSPSLEFLTEINAWI